jgi:hypothetical protein
MVEAVFRYVFMASNMILTATLLAMTGCANAPTKQSIAGLSPAGKVSISEVFIVGWGGGNGMLNYQGQAYPFKFVCTILGPGGGGQADVDRVVGPGGGLSRIIASGEVYKLASVADFSGRYMQNTGGGEVWLHNSAGVIMHLQGTRTGAAELIPALDEVAIAISH